MLGELVYETRAIQMYMCWSNYADAIWTTTKIIVIGITIYRHIKMFIELFYTTLPPANFVRVKLQAYKKMSRDWLIGLSIVVLPPVIILPKYLIPHFRWVLLAMVLLFCFMMLYGAASKTQKTDA